MSETAESISSGLTFDEFAMGFRANLLAAVDADSYLGDPSAAWSAKDSVDSLTAMSDADPDFHTALTDVDPHSAQARRDDALVKVGMALAGTVELPEGPASAEFEDLLRQSSLGPSIEANRWY